MSSQVSITLRAIDLASKPIAGVTNSLGLMKFALVGLGAAVGREFIRVNSELEQMRVKLAGLFGGNMKVGEDALKWVRDFQAANPVKSIEAMTDSFHSLVSAGIKPTEEAMKALIGGAVKYGLTEADLKRVLVAMRQITAITNAQKQELNQLSEKIPQISKKLSEEMGYKSPELFQQAMKRMEVDAKAMATATVRILAEGADESIENYGKTWEGGMVRLKTAWFDFMEALNSSGMFNRLKTAMDSITQALFNMAFYAKELGVEFDYLVQAGIDFGNAVGAGLVEIYNLINKVAGKATGSETGFGAFIMVVNAAIAGFRMWGATIKAEIKMAVDAFILLKDKMNAMLNPGKESDLKYDISRETEALAKAKASLERALYSRDVSKTNAWTSGDIYYLEESVKNLTASLSKLKDEQKDLFDLKSLDTRSFGKIYDEGVKEYKDAIAKIQGAQIKANAAVELAFNKKNDADKKNPRKLEMSPMLVSAIDSLGLMDAEAPIMKMPQTFAYGWVVAMKKAREEFDKTFTDIVALGKYAADSLTKAFTSGFELMFQQLKEGTVNLKDVMMNILNSVYDAMAKIIAQRMAIGLVTQVGTMFVSGAAQSTGATAGGGMASNDPYMSNAGGLQKASSQNSSKVEIINNSGQQLEVTQARSKGTGSDQIMTIVIDAVMRNKNGSRDMLRGALA